MEELGRLGHSGGDLLCGILFGELRYKSEPVFAKPEPLKLWGEVIRHSRHGLLGNAIDWDGNGRLSWLAGTEAGMFLLFRRAALDAAAAPPGYKITKVEQL